MEDLYNSLTPSQKVAFLNGPALAPPPYIKPNFDHPPNNNALCYAIIILSISVATVMVLVRLCSKIFCMKQLRVEDAIMVAAFGLYTGFIYIAWECFIHPGGFVHQWNMRVKDAPIFFKNINIACILYGVALLLLKLSIFLDWIHIFSSAPGIHSTFRKICIANIVVNLLFYVACILVEIFGCTPRSRIWNQLQHGTCVNIFAVNVASSAFNFLLDLIMIAMPQMVVWRMQLSLGKKVAISGLFAVGAFGCICGALRIVYSIPFMNSPDKSYTVTPFALSGIGEMTVGFMVLCIPSIPKLIKNTPTLNAFLDRVKNMFGVSSDEKPNSRLGLPSWIRAGARGRQDNTHFSMIDEHASTAALGASKEKVKAMSETKSDTPEFITIHAV